MDELLPKQRSALARAVSNPDLVWILMNKAKGAKWLAAFADVGWLDPQHFPGPTPQDKKGYFSVPSWPLTHYLAENASDFLLPENRAAAERLLAFLSDTTRLAQERGQHNYRVWWNFARTVQGIPADLFDERRAEMLSYWLADPFDRGLTGEELSKWAKVLLESDVEHHHRLAFFVLRQLFALHVGKGDDDERIGLAVNHWYAERIGERLLELAVAKLDVEFVDLLRERVEEVTRTLANDQWSCIWRPAIEPHDQNRSSESAQQVLVSLFRDALEQHSRSRPDTARSYVDQLLASELQIVQRTALHCVRVIYPQLEPLINSAIDPRFFGAPYRHELWWLLHDHFRHFTADQRHRTLKVIGDLEEAEDAGVRQRQATAYRQASWFAAIQDDAEGRKRFDESVSIAGAEPEHPDFSSYTSVGWVRHESPIDVEELKALTPSELVGRLRAYVEPAQLGFREAGYEGLVKAVRPVIKADPLKYVAGLQEFRSLDLPFIYEVIEAYGELWREDASLPWGAIWPGLLQFAHDVVSHGVFWSEGNKTSPKGFVGNRYWINGSIGRLIESGTKSDDRAMPASCHESALYLLEFIIARESGEEFSAEKDAVSIAINSPRGRCLEALINLSLRECRLQHAEEGNHDRAWEKFQPHYDREFARTGEHEFATLFVNYLPNFLYLSKSWTLSRLPDAFDASNSTRWSCAMQAYAYVANVYQEIYRFLRDGGHFVAALDDINLSDRVSEKIVQNACVAYLHGQEQLHDVDGLIGLIARRRMPKEISHVIRFFWSLRGSPRLGQAERERVVQLWAFFDRDVSDASVEGTVPIGKFIRWLEYLPRLEGEFLELALRAASALCDTQENYTYDLLRTLARFSSDTPNEVAEVWLRALEGSQMSYPEEAVREALLNIFLSEPNGRQLAKQVVSAYAKKGNLVPHEMLKSFSHSK